METEKIMEVVKEKELPQDFLEMLLIVRISQNIEMIVG